MYRTHNCGELRKSDINSEVILSGWVQRIRNKGFLIWIDLRDRYGITQILINSEKTPISVIETAKSLAREFVISVKGKVIEREACNDKIATGEIEISVENIEILNKSEVPPFTIEDESDGGDELRMKYRYLDLRRNPVKNNIIFRNNLSFEIRKYLKDNGFIDIETPYLIKSTPEGARDFIVPSRINQGEFYALPQSPQTFKQLLMISGFDKYFQIVKCFRDEDLRADRQPEFTQIDCEMSFVNQEDVISTFEGLVKYLFNKCLNINLNKFKRISYNEAIEKYGSDKPDTRFEMDFFNSSKKAKGNGFKIFDDSEAIYGFNIKSGAELSRKEIDSYTDWVKRPQIGALGLIWIKHNLDGSIKSSIDKFYSSDQLKDITKSNPGEISFIISGNKKKTLTQLGALRIEVAERFGLRNNREFEALWVTDFPLFEWDEESKNYHSMHHPFTSPVDGIINEDPSETFANAYDLVINGNEIGGGSIRIHNKELQQKVFSILGFSEKEAIDQFGFLLNAFKYGAPPHGGIAFGLDRLVAVMNHDETIRDYIAFPKNNSGRDVMIDSPSKIDNQQLDDLNIKLK
jgi:aspartyl-tRNA synthetase|tara:strand:- start:129 stop:1856 length:1728 start_codon:yes stop_codon:yes gene_type:complete